MKHKLALLFVLLASLTARPQVNNNLAFYYPDQVLWPLEINVSVHVMQYAQNDPRNFTPADTGSIHEIFQLVNQMYNVLQPPTLKVKDVPFYNESKIRFAIDKIFFHVDSLGWKAEWAEPVGFVKIEEYRPAVKSFVIKGKTFRNYRQPDGIYLEYKNGKGRKLTCDTAYLENGFSVIRVKEKVDTTGMSRLGYYNRRNANCATENYQKYGSPDPYHLHVFLTRSTVSDLVFGCGPSKNFLNLSNAYKGNNWVIAQLLAHELGHCLGLSHTNYPQYPDLPPKDEFGWLACDSISVSNNIMGYNVCRSYLSPMQIGSVHQRFSDREDHIRLTKNQTYNPAHTYTVKGRTVPEQNLVINGDVIIKKNATLVVKKTFYVHEQSRIILEDGAKIEVDGGRLVVMDNRKNANIIYCKKFGSEKKPKIKGEIKTNRNGKIIGLQIP